MISTTTNTIEGMQIREYKGIVFGEVISGVNFVRDIAASFSNFFGGRSNSYEQELLEARSRALAEMEQRAACPWCQCRGRRGYRLRSAGRR